MKTQTKTILNIFTIFALLLFAFGAHGVTPAKASIDTTSFAPRVDVATEDGPEDVKISDIDGDGKLDVLVLSFSGTFSFYKNATTNGNIDAGTLPGKVSFTTGPLPTFLTVGDLDGDGKPDVIVLNVSSISVFRNTTDDSSPVTFVPFANKVDFATTGPGPVSAAINDLDGDGKLDIVVTNSLNTSVSVFRNTSTVGSITASSFAPKVDFEVGRSPHGIAVGDLDGDGKNDIVVVNNEDNKVSILRNKATSGSITSTSFAPGVSFSTQSFPEEVAIGDLDGDGKKDLAVTNSGSDSVSVLKNTSTPGTITSTSFAPKADFSTLDTGAKVDSIAISDLDQDGKLDLVVTKRNLFSVSVLWNNGTVGAITSDTFANVVNFGAGTTPSGVAIGDLNGDGKPDIAVTNLLSDTVSLYKNTAFPIFADVPFSHFANFFIEILFRSGISGGCSTNPLLFCPDAPVTRAQMAIFILRGMHGSNFIPPAATGTVFSDVPADAFAANFIEQLAAEGITGGCGNGNYCPDTTVTRAQMAIFLLRGEHGNTFTPPPATGTIFSDVPAGSFAADFIEQLAAENITGGCGNGNYCPDATVTRAQMAIFLVKTFIFPHG